MSTQAGGVKFDGFKDGMLLEAKGPGYAKFFEGLEPKRWFRNVAEKAAADAFRELFKNARVEGIEIVHTPAL